ncbi:multiprotein-bridging factor 1 [Serendipita sp. 399]|nr:multiprotein-bridging factor 1 [Serendipita sp. 399]
MAAQAQSQPNSGMIRWNLFGGLGKLGRAMIGRSDDDSPPRVDVKRRRSPVQLTTDDESPQKRVKRSEPLAPPKSLSIAPPGPVSSVQPTESSKKLTKDAVQRLGRVNNGTTYRPSDAQSVTSARTGLSRAPSTGLSFAMNRIQLQSPSSLTPAAGYPHLTMRPAGVAQKLFNVNSPLAPSDSTPFPTKSTSPSGPVDDDRMSATPGGATFGPMRQPFHRKSSTAYDASPPKSPSYSRPVIDRHAVSAPWAGRSGSLQTHRLGDGSLGRGRTTSLVSAAALTSSGTSSPDNDRKTPTPKDSSGSVTSPTGSSVGSPPPPPPKRLGAKPIEGFAQRALKGIGGPTPLKPSRSFSQPFTPQMVKVPLPSQGSSTSFSRGSDAASVRSYNKGDSSEKSKHEKSASAPYLASREGHQSRTKKILDKRKEEEKELLEIKREMEEEVRVEAVKPDEENEDQTTSRMEVEDNLERTTAIIEKNQKSRMSALSSDSNSTVGRSQLRMGRDKTNHSGSIAVSKPDPERTRIPSSQVVHRFDPNNNYRLKKVMHTGRFSVPPDDEEEEQRAAKAARAKSPPLVIPAKPGHADDVPTSEPMNISPVKESMTDLDSNVDMASTTPTQSSMQTAFSMTPLGTNAPPSTSLDVSKPMETENPTVSENGDTEPTNASSKPAPVFSFATPPEPKPKKAADVPAAPPKLSPVFSSSKADTTTTGPTSNGGFSFLAPPVPASKPVINPLPFSFGIPPTKPQVEPSVAPSTVASNSGADTKAGPVPSFFGAPSKSVEKEAPKAPLFGGLSATRPDLPKPLDLTATKGVTQPALETPKVSNAPFSFGNLAAATTPSAGEAKKDGLIFSFGPPKPTNPPPAIFPTTPASTPGINVTSSTPAPLSLGTTTPQSSPFSFVSDSSSPIKPSDSADLKTPTKSSGFAFNAVSTTPAATPAPTGFSFGQSTTPAATPSAPSFSFGTSSTTKTPGFPFGNTAPSTTPSSTPAPNASNFTFSFGGGNNPFQGTTTASSKSFVFGDSQGPTTAPPSFSFGQTPGDATPKPKEQSSTFTFGHSAPPLSAPATGGFSFGTLSSANASGPAASGSGLLFPSGPTTPLQNKLELDSMDASPIRGGGSGSNPPNTSGAGSTFSFGLGGGNTGVFTSTTNNAPFGSSNLPSGSQGGSVFGGTGFTRESSAPPSITFGTGAPGFGQQQTPTSSNPFPQTQGGFGSNAPFSFGQAAGSSSSPFGQSQSLPSPATAGFGQTASPAASPFNPPASLGSTNIFGVGAGLKRPPSPGGGPDPGLVTVGDRKIMPLPKPRRARRSGTVVAVDRRTTGGSNKAHQGPDHQRIAKVDRENEVAPPPKVNPAVGRAMQTARLALQLSQRDLAAKINEKPSVLQDIETGRATANPQILAKIERQLGVKLRGNDIGAKLGGPKRASTSQQ